MSYPRPPAVPVPDDQSLARTVAFWLFVLGQAGTIALFASGVRPSAGYPQPVEATADLALAVVQVTLAALLGPALLADRAAVVRAMATVVAFWAIGDRLSATPAHSRGKLLAIVLAWLPALALLCRSPLGRLVAAFLVIAVPMLAYAQLEYAGQPWPTGLLAAVSPTLGVLTTGLHGMAWTALLPPAGMILVATAARFRPKLAGQTATPAAVQK